jgi:hypothetical protein
VALYPATTPTYVNQTTLTTASAWPAWNITYTMTGATLTNASTYAEIHIVNATWGAWNASTTNYATTNLVATWPTWNEAYLAHAAQMAVAGRAPTQEELKAADERRKAEDAWRAEQVRSAREQEARRAVEASAARRRAGDLLHRSLTPEQREDLKRRDCFFMDSIAANGERRRYRIDRGTHGNVKLLDKDGRIIGRYCVQPNGVPVEDCMLAQKLWLESNEAGFIRAANFTPQRAM